MTFDHDVHVKSSEKLEKHGKLHGLNRGPSFFTVFFRTPSLKKNLENMKSHILNLDFRKLRKNVISYSKI